MNNEELVDTLNDLIETCKDGEYGFSQCAQYASASDLRNLFQARAAECRQAAQELASLVRLYGGDPDMSGTIAGAIHRGWVSVRSAVTTDEDAAMLEECERGEDRAKAQYRKALSKPLPESVLAVVTRQNAGVVRNHDQVKALRERYRALHH
ncbi:ferritin-like domain-containing protein [Chitinimonas lacunae]|uniref:PA2169 family four-helix-bundle protein n=1 Tax=Chitinimonas lacunae TaxID=1963018 RepID=A0ABV8MMV6_9NEIS